MKLTKILWIFILAICLGWLYFLIIKPTIYTKKMVSVPDVVGLSEADAIDFLNRNNIKYNIIYLDGDNSNILYTMPKAGTNIYCDYKIDLYVNKIVEHYYPNFVGESIDNIDIENLFNDYNISYEIEYCIKNDYPEGVILEQSKTEHDVMLSGDHIKFVVSASNNDFIMPKLIGLNINEAIDILNSYNLSYEVLYTFSIIDEDIVLSQSTSSGVVLKKGNTYPIELYVSKGIPDDACMLKINDLYYDCEICDIIYVDSTLKSGSIIKICRVYNCNDYIYEIYVSN